MDISEGDVTKGMKYSLNNICLIIPALNPGQDLLEILEKLTEQHQLDIIVVNDGSSPNSATIFNKVAMFPKTTIVHHDNNQGKGAALKSGFSYFMNNFQNDHTGVVCLDGDGQHLPKDVINIAKRLQTSPKEQLILGARNFTKKIPFRSKFGNQTIKFLFKLFHNIYLTDTQTGLRGIPNKLIPLFGRIPYNHYEFESACLLETKQQGLSIEEVEITTVYKDNNESSHFLPIKDSYKIFKVILCNLTDQRKTVTKR